MEKLNVPGYIIFNGSRPSDGRILIEDGLKPTKIREFNNTTDGSTYVSFEIDRTIYCVKESLEEVLEAFGLQPKKEPMQPAKLPMKLNIGEVWRSNHTGQRWKIVGDHSTHDDGLVEMEPIVNDQVYQMWPHYRQHKAADYILKYWKRIS